MGFINVLLPFFFTYIIVFATLEKTKILGEENGKARTNLNAIVAFCLGFMFIASVSIVTSLIVFLQYLAMGLIFTISVFFALAAWFGDEIKFKGNKYTYFIGSVFVICIFLFAIGLLNKIPISLLLGAIFNPITLVVGIFALIIWYISGDGKGSNHADEEIEKELINRGARRVGPGISDDDDHDGSL